MIVMRYSGTLVVSIRMFKTMHGAKYRCTVRDGDEKFTCEVGSPAMLVHGIDSLEAFDDAATVAMSLAFEEAGLEGAAYDDEGGVFHVGRKAEDAWP